MCGKERGGLESAEEGLFAGARFVLTPTRRTTNEALALASELASAVGARPFVLDADRHDRAAALISHMPYLLAATLVHTERKTAEKDAVAEALAASGFRDTTRLAAGESEMMVDILLTNTEAVRASLRLFGEQLAAMQELLERPEELRAWMLAAQAARRRMFR
jgi:prephenate dehydrogenase